MMTKEQFASILGYANGFEIAFRRTVLPLDIPGTRDQNRIYIMTSEVMKLAKEQYPFVFDDINLQDIYVSALLVAVNADPSGKVSPLFPHNEPSAHLNETVSAALR